MRIHKFFLSIFVFFSFSLAAHNEENGIIVCDNGLEMFGWNLEFIHHAKHSIDIAACFLGGQIAQELLSAIEARLEVCPDLKVHILASPTLLEKQDWELIEHLKQQYPHQFFIVFSASVTVVWPDISAIDNHIKMCVIDETYFSIGGTNLDESQCTDGTYTPPPRKNQKMNSIASDLPGGMRDQDIVGRGPIAKDLRQAFCKLFALWEYYDTTYRLKRDPDLFSDNPYYFEIHDRPFVKRFERSNQLIELKEGQIKYFFSGPHQSKNSISEEYVRLIQGAKSEIKISNLYVCPADPIFTALLEAVNRGVKLTILTNGISELTPIYTQHFAWANRVCYVPYFLGYSYHYWDYWSVKNKKAETTKIFEYNVKDIMLHKKIMIVDDTVFVVGSYNLGQRSHLSDYENIVVITSPEVVRAANIVHSRDLQYCREVSFSDAVGWYFNPMTATLGELQKRLHGLL